MGLSCLASACTIVGIITISVLILFAIIIHLCYVCREKGKLQDTKRKKIQFFLLMSVITVTLYQISNILLMDAFIQIILIETHVIHPAGLHPTDHIYYSSDAYLEYLVASFNEIAHLGVILVFIVRFHCTFHNNLFANHKRTLLALYFCTLLLFIGGVVIVVMMVMHQPTDLLIIVELVWDMLVHIMWLWILYLFMSKLYVLLKLSLDAYNSSGDQHTDFLKSLIEATKLSGSDSKDIQNTLKHSQTGPNAKSNVRKYTCTMTIDGIKTDPHRRSPNTSRNASPEPSPDPSRDPSVHTATVPTRKMTATDCEGTENCAGIAGPSNAIDFIGVMTKMTILVTFTVFVGSICGICHELLEEAEYGIDKRDGHHELTQQALWAELPPVIDGLISCGMLYLQFNFTHKTYRRLFGRFDAWFLTHCLRFVVYIWDKKIKKGAKNGSFLAETASTNMTKSLE